MAEKWSQDENHPRHRRSLRRLRDRLGRPLPLPQPHQLEPGAREDIIKNMSTILTRNVQDLSAASRENLEQLLGTPLQARERVHIVVESPPEGPPADVKLLAAQRIRQIIAQAEARAEQQGIPDAEIDSAVQEAMAHVRQRA